MTWFRIGSVSTDLTKSGITEVRRREPCFRLDGLQSDDCSLPILLKATNPTMIFPKSVIFGSLFALILVAQSHAFASVQAVFPATTATTNCGPSDHVGGYPRSKITLNMGLFDAFSKAFENTEYGPPAEAVKATASHILVPTQQEAQVVMKMISSGEMTFEECAQDFSTCPSSSKGGSLGSFSPGTMVAEFDKVIFDPETQIGAVQGPVLTEFGFHVIRVDKRSGGGDWY